MIKTRTIWHRWLMMLLCAWSVACGGRSAQSTTPSDADSATSSDTDSVVSSDSDTSAPMSPDPWVRVFGDGLGTPTLNTAPEVEVFKGYLFVALAPKDTGLAKLYRSQTGELGSFEDVTPPLDADRGIHAFGKTTLGGGYLWCGTGGANGSMIFRSDDGAQWVAIAHRGFGDPKRKGATPHMVVFQDPADGKSYLYAGMGSHGAGVAAIVKRIPIGETNPDSWQTVHDFTGSQPLIDQVTYFYVWKNTLYFATNVGAQLWQSSDGVNFSKNGGVNNGFGDSTNAVIASIEAFGEYLYATTTNFEKGGQLWRTKDGLLWEPVTTDAFGKGKSVSELRSIRVAFGKLWLTAYTDVMLSAGTSIWRSDDGTNWLQSNLDGFGDPHNNGQNAVVIGFGDYEYFAGPNYVDGAQLWRARMR